jgi:hypothetical protein
MLGSLIKASLISPDTWILQNRTVYNGVRARQIVGWNFAANRSLRLPTTHYRMVDPGRLFQWVPGIFRAASMPSRDLYLVDPATLQMLLRFCDGTEVPLLCEPGILRAPAGLALDRCGLPRHFPQHRSRSR